MHIYNYTSWSLHFYMYAQKQGQHSGTRYDVGNDVGWAGINKRNIFSVIEGGYVSARYANRKDLDGKGVKTHKLTYLQWVLWHATVVGSHSENCAIPLDYSINPIKGTNCLNWTLWANAKAVMIKRLPI